MGRDLVIRAYNQPDDKTEKMTEAYLACEAAGVQPPLQVEEYFDWEKPTPYGIPRSGNPKQLSSVEEINEAGFNGFAIKIDELPKDLKTIVVGISY